MACNHLVTWPDKMFLQEKIYIKQLLEETVAFCWLLFGNLSVSCLLGKHKAIK